MFVEIHVLQSFAPSNLNRDDMGSPKDCEFGGFRRARVSSQCWKRAIRDYFVSEDLPKLENRAVRTKKLASELDKRLRVAKPDATDEERMMVATAALGALGFGVAKEQKTSVLLFLGHDQIETLAGICGDQWEALLASASTGNEKKQKKTAAIALPKEVQKGLVEALNGSKAVDLALFGRMIAEAPGQNVDAACQVAHAISTHRVAPEFDYYTAVDDLNPSEETGAGMVGVLEFNSACFYRYANVNVSELEKTLGDSELAEMGLRAFLQSFIRSIPKAKQNSHAAQSLPSLVFVVVRDKGLWSLSNAFLKPVDGRGDGLMANSIEQLSKHWTALEKMYGGDGVRLARVSVLDDLPVDAFGKSETTSIGALVDSVIAEIQGAQ